MTHLFSLTSIKPDIFFFHMTGKAKQWQMFETKNDKIIKMKF